MVSAGYHNWPIAFPHSCLTGQYSRTDARSTDWGYASFSNTGYSINAEGSTAADRTSSVVGIGY